MIFLRVFDHTRYILKEVLHWIYSVIYGPKTGRLRTKWFEFISVMNSIFFRTEICWPGVEKVIKEARGRYVKQQAPIPWYSVYNKSLGYPLLFVAHLLPVDFMHTHIKCGARLLFCGYIKNMKNDVIKYMLGILKILCRYTNFMIRSRNGCCRWQARSYTDVATFRQKIQYIFFNAWHNREQ